MVALGFGLVAPALPLFAREFGVGKAAAGAVVSAFALMRLVMAPFVGRLVNAFGERVLLAAGIGVVAVSSALAGLVPVLLAAARPARRRRHRLDHVQRQRGQPPGQGHAEPPARPGPGRVGGRVPDRPGRRAGGRHGGDLLAAAAVLPLRRHARRRRPARARRAAPQRAGRPPVGPLRAVGPGRRAAQPRLPRRPRGGLRRRVRAGRRPVGDGAALRARLAPPVGRLGVRRVPHRQRGQRRPPAADRQDRGHGRSPAGDRRRAAGRSRGVRAAPGAAGDRRSGGRDGADRRGRRRPTRWRPGR